MEKYGIKMLKKTKPMLNDLGTYLTKVGKYLMFETNRNGQKIEFV